MTYTVPTPGQWVVGELPELPRQESGGSGATVTLSNATGPLGDWRVRTVEARLVGMACSIHIASDGMGTWTTAGGSP